MVKVLVRTLELGIGISICLGVGRLLVAFLSDSSLGSFIESTFYNLGYLFGPNITALLYSFFLGFLLIMCGRWILSFFSTDAGRPANQ